MLLPNHSKDFVTPYLIGFPNIYRVLTCAFMFYYIFVRVTFYIFFYSCCFGCDDAYLGCILAFVWLGHPISWYRRGFSIWFLEPPIQLKLLVGFEAPANDCFKLDRAIYRLVKSSRIWWKTFTAHPKNKKFCVSRADSCMSLRQEKYVTCTFVLYIDNGFSLNTRQPFIKESVISKKLLLSLLKATLKTTLVTNSLLSTQPMLLLSSNLFSSISSSKVWTWIEQ